MKSPGNKPRAGAVRKGRKGPQVGSGGQGRQALEGKKPTPKAVDRPYHPAGKRRAAADRFEAAGGRKKQVPDGAAPQRTQARRSPKSSDESEMVTGRNSVLEALRAKIPVTTLYMAARIEFDDRVKEILQIATTRGVPILEVMRPELDRLAGFDSVHQGVALKVPPYEYAHPIELLEKVVSRGQVPLFVALDGITDPRNLGAIIRSVSAFSGHGVIVPERRSVGVTASAWKTSAGAAVRVPVARAANLNNTLKAFKNMGIYVLGLDGDGDVSLPDLALATEPVCIVVGSEGTGLSRLVRENCDQIVSIPIDSAMESLNASMAVGISLYEISRQRAVK